MPNEPSLNGIIIFIEHHTTIHSHTLLDLSNISHSHLQNVYKMGGNNKNNYKHLNMKYIPNTQHTQLSPIFNCLMPNTPGRTPSRMLAHALRADNFGHPHTEHPPNAHYKHSPLY